MAENPKAIHIFRQGLGTFGYTRNPSGNNLPDVIPGLKWEFISTIVPEPDKGPQAGPSMDVVQAGIARDGVYVAKNVVTVKRAEA